MNSSLRKFILLVITLLLAANTICPPPERVGDLPAARLLKGDMFKLDIADYFRPQSVRIQGSTQVKFESMISPAYREITIPKYTFKIGTDPEVTLTMNNCLFGVFSEWNNWALCGSEKDVTYWEFKTNRYTNAVDPTSLMVKYMGKDQDTVTTNNIQRCETVVTNQDTFGKWIVCFSKKSGDDNNSIKLVLVHIHDDVTDKTSPYSGVRSIVLENKQGYPLFLSDIAVDASSIGKMAAIP